jgi:hypothetical protein
MYSVILTKQKHLCLHHFFLIQKCIYFPQLNNDTCPYPVKEEKSLLLYIHIQFTLIVSNSVDSNFYRSPKLRCVQSTTLAVIRWPTASEN